jgi:hypothetical protein
MTKASWHGKGSLSCAGARQSLPAHSKEPMHGKEGKYCPCTLGQRYPLLTSHSRSLPAARVRLSQPHRHRCHLPALPPEPPPPPSPAAGAAAAASQPCRRSRRPAQPRRPVTPHPARHRPPASAPARSRPPALPGVLAPAPAEPQHPAELRASRASCKYIG